MPVRDWHDSGHFKSVREQQREREDRTRDRRAEANSAYLADEANN